jgi:hypothetical protein
MTVEPGTTMREWEKRRAAVVGSSADGVNGLPTTPDPLVAVLERIATALETIAGRGR